MSAYVEDQKAPLLACLSAFDPAQIINSHPGRHDILIAMDAADLDALTDFLKSHDLPDWQIFANDKIFSIA
jgi:hypothetical protein